MGKWDHLHDPSERARLADALGPEDFNKAMQEFFAENTIAVENGYAIRRTVSARFGTLYVIDGGTLKGFQNAEDARAFARTLPPRKFLITWTPDTGNGEGFQVTTLSGQFCGVFPTMRAAIAHCEGEPPGNDADERRAFITEQEERELCPECEAEDSLAPIYDHAFKPTGKLRCQFCKAEFDEAAISARRE